MNTKIYIDNLPAVITENELTDLFSTYGNVVAINIAVDRDSQKPRGFGFVTMATAEGAQAAIRELNGKTVGTSTLTVSEGWLDEESADRPNGRRAPRRRASLLY